MITVSFVGRLDDPVKDPQRALRVMCRVLAALPHRAQFLLWGPSSEERRRELESLVPDALRECIQFRGATADVAAIYRETDILLLTSRSEGSPRVIMEAGSQGIPAVATNVGGVPELIIHGQTGFLFDVDTDGEAFLRQLLTDEQLRYQLGRNACRHFHENFAWNRVIEHYVDFYRMCLQREPRKEYSA